MPKSIDKDGTYKSTVATDKQDLVSEINGKIDPVDNPDNNVKEPNQETLQLLGNETANKFGPEIHNIIVDIWSKIIKEGISKEEKKVIAEKYPRPSNFTMLKAPDLNAEIKELAKGVALKKDSFNASSQNTLSSGMTAISLVLNDLLTKKEIDMDTIIGRLGNAGRLLSELHHAFSISQRIISIASIEALDPLEKCVAIDCPVANFLFGEDFSERYKQAKALKKSRKEFTKSRSRQTESRKDGTAEDKSRKSNMNLNWKGHKNPNPRQQGGQKYQSRFQQSKSYQNRRQ